MLRQRAVSVVVAALVACSCAKGPAPAPGPRPLVAGTTSEVPPYALRRGDALAGLEVDLAAALGRAMQRRVEVVDLHWAELGDALAAGRVDIVMAGVTITPERQTRFAFSDPYMHPGVGALVRRDDRNRYRSRDAVCRSPIDVGVVGGTTAEKQLRERCPAMIPRLYPRPEDAVRELIQHRVDAVVHDQPVLQWLLSQNEGDVVMVPTGITEQPVAWMLRRDDAALREAVDAALARLRADGTLDAIVARWVPPSGPGH